MKSNIGLLAVATLGGVGVTLGLLLAINLLANYRAHVQTSRPLLVVDLMRWPTLAPSIPEQAKMPPQPTPPKPKIKKPVPLPEPELAPVARKVVTARLEAVQPNPLPMEKTEGVDEAPSEPLSHPMSTEASLPTPVPIFQLTQTPRFLHREVPVYPEVMRAQGVTGVVKLEVLIDKEGRVRTIRILKSAGENFDEAAKRAILASNFYPAEINNEAVAVLLRLPVKFNLF